MTAEQTPRGSEDGEPGRHRDGGAHARHRDGGAQREHRDGPVAHPQRDRIPARPAYPPPSAPGPSLPSGPLLPTPPPGPHRDPYGIPVPEPAQAAAQAAETAEAADAPSLRLQLNALQALARQVFAFRLAMIALGTPFALGRTAPGAATWLIGAAVLITFMGSYVMWRDWERFGPLLLKHPALLGVDLLFSSLLLLTATPESTLGYVTVCTPLLAGLAYGWRGAGVFAGLQILVLAAAYGANPGIGGGLAAMVVLPGFCAVAGAAGVGLRNLLIRFGAAGRALTEARARLAAAEAVGEERARLAREMHDSVAKTLHGLALAADGLASSAGRPDTPPEALRRRADMVAHAARHAAAESRALLSDLRNESGAGTGNPGILLRSHGDGGRWDATGSTGGRRDATGSTGGRWDATGATGGRWNPTGPTVPDATHPNVHPAPEAVPYPGHGTAADPGPHTAAPPGPPHAGLPQPGAGPGAHAGTHPGPRTDHEPRPTRPMRPARPEFHTDVPLGAVADELAARTAEWSRATGIPADFRSWGIGCAPPLPGAVPPGVARQLLTIAAEALENTQRHACASRVVVEAGVEVGMGTGAGTGTGTGTVTDTGTGAYAATGPSAAADVAPAAPGRGPGAGRDAEAGPRPPVPPDGREPGPAGTRILRISVLDDGCGLPPCTTLDSLRAAGHYGLVGMVERAAGVGARLRIGRGHRESGTEVRLELPVAPPAPGTGLPLARLLDGIPRQPRPGPEPDRGPAPEPRTEGRQHHGDPAHS